MAHRNHRALFVSVLIFAVVAAVHGQRTTGPVLPILIRGNEQFGRRLLAHLHSGAPDRNAVVSPVSISLLLSAVDSESVSYATHGEVSKALGWGQVSSQDLMVASRMLLVAFEKPTPPTRGERVNGGPPLVPDGGAEAAWIENAFLYRGQDTLSTRFMSRAEKFFGMTFTSTGQATPTAVDIQRSMKSAGPLPATAPRTDFVISSGTHLQTRWAGNTFLNKPHPDDFTTFSGQRKSVDVLTSETARYRYAKTERFEAVVLPCNHAYLVAVLPAPGRDILDLERELAATPDALDTDRPTG
jgi:hypothetical protein